MTVKVRLSALLVFVVASFAVLLVLLQRSQEQQVELLYRERAEATRAVVSRILQLKSESPAAHVEDYSRWDDMVQFVAQRDSAWAEINLIEGTGTFGVDLIWVLNAAGDVAFTTGPQLSTLSAVPHGAMTQLMGRLRSNPFLHYFTRRGDQVVEVWAAPIQPSEDLSRSTPPVGYYLVGRVWSKDVLADIAEAAHGGAFLLAGQEASASGPGTSRSGIIRVELPLADLDDRLVARLRFVTPYPIAREVRDASMATVRILVVCVATIVAVIFLFLGRWVVRPLEKLSAALRHGEPARMDGLQTRRDELGRMAQLIVEFTNQRLELLNEVERRKAAVSELAVQQHLIREIIDTDPNLIFVLDAEGRFVLANASIAAFVEVAPTALMGQPVDAVLHYVDGGQAVGRVRQFVARSGRPRMVEELLTSGGGEPREFHTIYYRLGSGGIGQILGIAVDVTERLQQQRALHEAKEAAEAGAKAKAQFLASISHELRTPLHGLLSFARFGVQEADQACAPGLKGYFENIEECGTGLLELLNDLLDLSRLEAGRMQLSFEEHDLNDVVDTVQMEFEAAANERQMRFALIGEEQLPAARIDRGRMVQVLRNLVSNALKFSPAGSTIEIERTSDDRFVRIAVKDRGIGIPEGELESIFDKFVQSTKTPTAAGGTGLGLAICRELIDAHGGRIWAENREGGGAIMAFEVPLASRAPSAARADDLMELGISQSHAPLPV